MRRPRRQSLRAAPWAALLLVALPLLAASGAAAQDTASLPFGGAETLRFTPPPGWTEVYRDAHPDRRVVHLVPAGQSRTDWQDMVTVQVLKTAAPPTLDALHARAQAQYEQACAAPHGGALQRGETNGLETGFWTLGCGHNTRSDHGETAFFKAVRGLEGIYLVQRIWRTAPFDPASGPGIDRGEQRAAIQLLAKAVVCVPDSHAHPCP
ncbi:hypothetical protein F1188_14695 [Roseospira marina]|uniref:DUF4136 domain-containing protein n=1 Tax=Roseospira marina TaxID=140057 RepID=A0A5M6IAA7_9PROT|nr:hypothetical protein [Roseospira marina]KAA5604659.1 hypothetical protein F1188_14695 [Roseospira marina]MBB4315104.1 hypothetical protein [Roseospira marina]MBB5088126.1 hypothetical protein [Roseospira marina]